MALDVRPSNPFAPRTTLVAIRQFLCHPRPLFLSAIFTDIIIRPLEMHMLQQTFQMPSSAFRLTTACRLHWHLTLPSDVCRLRFTRQPTQSPHFEIQPSIERRNDSNIPPLRHQPLSVSPPRSTDDADTRDNDGLNRDAVDSNVRAGQLFFGGQKLITARWIWLLGCKPVICQELN